MSRESDNQSRSGRRALGIGAALGGMAAYLFDPQNGHRRRALVRDRSRAFVRRAARRAERAGRGVGAKVYGTSQQVRHRKEQPKSYDDATLVNKVETELFRAPDVPKGDIVVNAARGVVQLRGQVDRPELIEELVERTRSIQGVRDVENLLHLPGTEAPMHQ